MKFRWLAPLLPFFVARAVHAAEPLSESPAESPAPQRSEWYGWQTALVDVASLGLGAAVIGLSGNSSSGSGAENVAGVLMVSTFVLGGPVVHAAHGQWGKAGASLGLRLGAPAAGALGGFLAGSASCPHDDGDVPCSAVGAGIGLIAGAATAIIVDAVMIAYEPEQTATRGVRVVPVLIAEHDRWGAGLSCAF